MVDREQGFQGEHLESVLPVDGVFPSTQQQPLALQRCGRLLSYTEWVAHCVSSVCFSCWDKQSKRLF